MTCFFCKGDMFPDTTTYMEDCQKGIVAVKHVPCHKCSQCGEVAYTGGTVRRLERILDALQEAMPEIAVLNYQEKAA